MCDTRLILTQKQSKLSQGARIAVGECYPESATKPTDLPILPYATMTLLEVLNGSSMRCVRVH